VDYSGEAFDKQRERAGWRHSEDNSRHGCRTLRGRTETRVLGAPITFGINGIELVRSIGVQSVP
jgi:hypothetical protein